MYEPQYDADSHALFFTDGPRQDRDCFGGALNVFVCGGLQQPDKMNGLIERRPSFAPAVVVGFRRIWKNVGGRDYPLMVPAPEEPDRPLTGVVWLDLTPEDLARIETLELDNNVRKRIDIKVLVGDRLLNAITYVER